MKVIKYMICQYFQNFISISIDFPGSNIKAEERIHDKLLHNNKSFLLNEEEESMKIVNLDRIKGQ